MSQIVIISAVFPPEPLVSATLSRDIAEELSGNHSVVVLCPKPTRPLGFTFEKKFEPAKYKLEHLNSFTCASSDLLGRFRESYSFGACCSSYIKKHSKQIDCLYINSWPLFAQYKIIKIAKKLHIPCVLHVQDIYPESLSNKLPILVRKLFTKFLLPIDKFILNNANVILGISPNMISYLSNTRKIDKKKFELIRNWQNDSQFLNSFPELKKEKKEKFVLMYVGSLSQSAGVANLIYSFHNARIPDSKLIIAGNGSDKDNCITIAHNLKNDQIVFFEVVSEAVPQFQSQSDILLLPLKKGIAKTATPSKLTAYLLSGKPVIACVEDDSDVADIITEAKCGFVVEPENVEILTETMQKIYKIKQSELENLGRNGREYALKNLSKKTNLKKVVSVIENLVDGNKKD